MLVSGNGLAELSAALFSLLNTTLGLLPSKEACKRATLGLRFSTPT